MPYWFTHPMLKLLLPMGNSTAIRGLTTTFAMPRMIMGANVFPRGKSKSNSAVHHFAPLCRKKRAFIVTDDFGRKLAQRVTGCIAPAGFKSTVWADVQPEAPMPNVTACAGAMTDCSPDVIIAIGGGSVIDGAKAAWIQYAQPEITDLGMVHPVKPLGLRSKAILVAVPTTSGTGSECTAVSVVHDTQAHRKIPVSNPELMPDIAVLCPEFTMSMPPGLTAGTGLDALSHAMDAVATPAANEITDSLALRAIKMIFTYLPRAYRNGNDREARHRMLLASSLAGTAFGQSGAALTHSFGHTIGSIFNIHHGLAVGVFIPYVFQYYLSVSEKFLDICDVLEISGNTSHDRLKGLVENVRSLFRELNVPLNLADMGISGPEMESKMETMVQYTIEDIDTLFSPRPITEKECARIFRYAHEGRDIDF
jgi:alcohol dehydrogenase class IV